ncbi:mitochondrial coenzyme A transporter SLC25A42 isoform X2 [Eurytemora carolleeae]|uniref:mitochondrial coenzyme A transporter SLC25A42 isoform X2 n=1 Tax=Eurytemora carolleeae TaxID=1294199 RepID=UPI000C789CC7|nr:mitochondrial coenzyme A transporter SLC25A42 isoform X2 [Eurytemora carolleeae]|eukprot:XP_023338243.1 mitochondrial coenzyme A transporter SLC25A42-like isoform X2 [Eurytemora affinis]
MQGSENESVSLRNNDKISASRLSPSSPPPPPSRYPQPPLNMTSSNLVGPPDTPLGALKMTSGPPRLSSGPPPVRYELTNAEKILTSLTAGAVAGGLAKTVIAPLDRSKIFFQTNETRNYRFRYAIRWLRHGYRNEGLFSLWRGNSATMARILPYAAIQFMSHEQYKSILRVEEKETPKVYRWFAGAMAGITGQLLTYPLDKVRAVMAVTKTPEFRSISTVLLKVQREEGVLALYRGLAPSMFGVMLYAGTSFFIFGTLKGAAVQHNGGEDPTFIQRVLAGAVAGLIGQTTSYPLDIVRRRMQTGVSLGKGSKYSTAVGTFMYVLRYEGVLEGLYKGLSMNMIKGPVAAGITFTTFDYVYPALCRTTVCVHNVLDLVHRSVPTEVGGKYQKS